MTDIEKARQLFQKAGLAFPALPEELAARLKERENWVFSTREIKMNPYRLEEYIREIDETPVDDYAQLSHSGHGVNSYAIQYYLVYGKLAIFLHLGWGGVYMDNVKAADDIRDCFALADEIVPAAHSAGKLREGTRLKIVGSDVYYGSYWSVSGEMERENCHCRFDRPHLSGPK